MSSPKPDPNLEDKPTPDDLAGIPVCKEEDHSTIFGSRGVKVRGRGGKRVRGGPPKPSPKSPPKADDLAGKPVSAEEEEDLTVRPSKLRRQK